jgi:hypothetical protein
MAETQPDRRVILAIILIALGAMSFMGMGLMWPMFILVPGLILLSIALFGGPAGAAAMSIPGMIVAGTGALLMVQNWTGYWESWAYAWTLYGVFLGMGFMLMGDRLGDDALPRIGQGFVRAGLIAFVAFGAFFELIIGISGRRAPLALALIVLGLFLLAREGTGRPCPLAGWSKPKRKAKPKRDADRLFTGPIVYGARVSSRRLAEAEDAPPVYAPEDEIG